MTDSHYLKLIRRGVACGVISRQGSGFFWKSPRPSRRPSVRAITPDQFNPDYPFSFPAGVFPINFNGAKTEEKAAEALRCHYVVYRGHTLATEIAAKEAAARRIRIRVRRTAILLLRRFVRLLLGGTCRCPECNPRPRWMFRLGDWLDYKTYRW